MPRAIVTGGAGFIGSHVCEAFLGRGYEVLAVDDLSTGVEANVPEGARLEVLDIVEGERVARVWADFAPTVVAHLGAQSSVTVSVRDPARDLDVNVRGTYHVCRASKDSGAPVIFASTGGAQYGDRATVPTPEPTPPEPLAPYGASKVAGEAYVATWGRLYGLPNVVLRLGNVYGPRQNAHGEAGVVAIFSHRLLAGSPPTVFGDGLQTRDYVHATDVAEAFATAGEGGRSGTYNVGWGAEVSVLEVLDALQAAAGTAIEPEFQPLREGELRRSALDSSRMAEELDWRPRVALGPGLRDTFDFYVAAERAGAKAAGTPAS